MRRSSRVGMLCNLPITTWGEVAIPHRFPPRRERIVGHVPRGPDGKLTLSVHFVCSYNGIIDWLQKEAQGQRGHWN